MIKLAFIITLGFAKNQQSNRSTEWVISSEASLFQGNRKSRVLRELELNRLEKMDLMIKSRVLFVKFACFAFRYRLFFLINLLLDFVLFFAALGFAQNTLRFFRVLRTDI
jgi:hypothetical protein